MTESWLLCGGQCSFIGFDSQGEEVYWNVAPDTISCVFKNLLFLYSNPTTLLFETEFQTDT